MPIRHFFFNSTIIIYFCGINFGWKHAECYAISDFQQKSILPKWPIRLYWTNPMTYIDILELMVGKVESFCGLGFKNMLLFSVSLLFKNCYVQECIQKECKLQGMHLITWSGKKLANLVTKICMTMLFVKHGSCTENLHQHCLCKIRVW